MVSTRNKYLDKVRDCTGVSDRNAAIQALVGRYRESGCALRSIAATVGVTTTIAEDIGVDGAVVLDGKHRFFQIKLGSRCSPQRRNFTLAHEIAHLMLSEVVHEHQLTACPRDKALEQVCDAIAAELVMPSDETTRFVRIQGEPSPGKLQTIADAFAVSLPTAARRIHEDLRLWKERIGLWNYDGRPRQKWFIGKRPWGFPTPNFAAFERALNSCGPVTTQESCFDNGSVTGVCLQVLDIGKNRLLGLVG